MARLAHTSAHKEVGRPDNGTQCSTNNQTKVDHKEKWYQCKDHYIDPQVNCTPATTISRHKIPCKCYYRSIEDNNKNSSLYEYWTLQTRAPRVDQTQQYVIDDRLAAPHEGKHHHGYQQSYDPSDQQRATIACWKKHTSCRHVRITSLLTKYFPNAEIYRCRSHFLRCLLTEQARRPEYQNKNENNENNCLVPCRSTMWQPNKYAWYGGVGNERGQRLDHTYQHAPKHSTNEIANTSKHRGSKSEQAKCKTQGEICIPVFQTPDECSRTGQRGTNKEGGCNNAVDIHPHQRGRLAVLRYGAHCTTSPSIANHPLQTDHQDNSNHEHQYIDAAEAHRPNIVDDLRENLWERDNGDTFPQLSNIFQYQEDTNSRDQWSKAWSVAQWTIGHTFNHHP